MLLSRCLGLGVVSKRQCNIQAYEYRHLDLLVATIDSMVATYFKFTLAIKVVIQPSLQSCFKLRIILRLTFTLKQNSKYGTKLQ